jgi:hypothetical protein
MRERERENRTELSPSAEHYASKTLCLSLVHAQAEKARLPGNLRGKNEFGIQFIVHHHHLLAIPVLPSRQLKEFPRVLTSTYAHLLVCTEIMAHSFPPK